MVSSADHTSGRRPADLHGATGGQDPRQAPSCHVKGTLLRQRPRNEIITRKAEASQERQRAKPVKAVMYEGPNSLMASLTSSLGAPYTTKRTGSTAARNRSANVSRNMARCFRVAEESAYCSLM